jgi:tetratricopeptide (TPR) repeat protein
MMGVGKRKLGLRRTSVMILGAVLLLAVSYGLSIWLHASAVSEVKAATEHIARADWSAAIGCLDRALWEDWFLVDAYMLRATAINGDLSSNAPWKRSHSRADALADLDRFLQFRPGSGEGHYQRALTLGGLTRAQEARDELSQAIALLADPTDALAERAALSFRVRDYESAINEISAAINRRPFEPEYYEQRELYRRFVHDMRGARADRAKAEQLREETEGLLENEPR